MKLNKVNSSWYQPDSDVKDNRGAPHVQTELQEHQNKLIEYAESETGKLVKVVEDSNRKVRTTSFITRPIK